MNFEINLTKNDYLAFQKYSYKCIEDSPAIKWKFMTFSIIYWLLLTMFLLGVFSLYKKNVLLNNNDLTITISAFTIWFVLSFLWQQYSRIFYVSTIRKKDGTIIGNWEIELSEEGIVESNDMSMSNYKWQCIEVKKDVNHLFLYIDSLKAIILPLNQINSDVESYINKNVTNSSRGTP